MNTSELSIDRDVPVAIGLGALVAVCVLVGIAVLKNSWRVWSTPAFCGSYADFHGPPVPEVCLSFPAYLRLSVTHLPHVGPAVLFGVMAAIGYGIWRRASTSATA